MQKTTLQTRHELSVNLKVWNEPHAHEKEDARKQSREVLHERQKQVIRMHRKGMPVQALEKSPERVRMFFQDARVKYAA